MEEKTVTVTLNQITLEVKFYLNQTAQNIIEVGKRLTQAKEMLPHGEFGNWLDSNFGLSERTARNFMAVSERFGKTEIDCHFNSTQMITMLALPAEDTEKFIEQKAAEGTPVEDMTIKTLREEVAKYKADYESEEAKVENLFSEMEQVKKQNGELNRIKSGLTDTLKDTRQALDMRTVQVNDLERQLKNQKPVEVVTPADYDATKKELAKLQAEQSEITQRMDVLKIMHATTMTGSAVCALIFKIFSIRFKNCTKEGR